ncbi:MAG TPA: hypothetical protein VJ579_02430 [Candidatus Paceibacterota bacterium]|nr:hypothetical protein [Candidatus Paceibacterota bacterium]
MANQESGAGMARERVASDIELTKGGADYTVDAGADRPRLEATQEQIEAMRGMENNAELGAAALQQIGERVAAEKAEAAEIEKQEKAKADALIVVQRDKLNQLYDAANYSPEERNDTEIGHIKLAVDLSKDKWTPRDQRPQNKPPVVQGFGDNRPQRAQAAGYYAGTLPTTAPPVQKPKGFLKGLFGGN